MIFKKTDGVGRNAKISKEEINVEVEHIDDELHNPYEVEEEV